MGVACFILSEIMLKTIKTYHWEDKLIFERLEDYSVQITIKRPEDSKDLVTVISSDEWVAIIAAVSQFGISNWRICRIIDAMHRPYEGVDYE